MNQSTTDCTEQADDQYPTESDFNLIAALPGDHEVFRVFDSHRWAVDHCIYPTGGGNPYLNCNQMCRQAFSHRKAAIARSALEQMIAWNLCTTPELLRTGRRGRPSRISFLNTNFLPSEDCHLGKIHSNLLIAWVRKRGVLNSKT